MRLSNVESGHDRPARIFIRTMERMTGTRLPDIVRVFSYRHRFFGTPFNALVQDVMRGRSFWTVAEREIFAAYTSRVNECPFCISAHRGVAGAYTDPDIVAAALDDPHTAALRPEAKAMLAYLRTMSLEPDTLDPADADHLRTVGIPDAAINQAVRIGTLFNVINRVMNALGSGPLEGRSLTVGRRTITLAGYRTPPPVRLLSRGT